MQREHGVQGGWIHPYLSLKHISSCSSHEKGLQVLNMWMQLLLSDQDKDESCCPFAATAETPSCMDRSYKWARRSAHTSVAAHGSGPVPSASPPVA